MYHKKRIKKYEKYITVPHKREKNKIIIKSRVEFIFR